MGPFIACQDTEEPSGLHHARSRAGGRINHEESHIYEKIIEQHANLRADERIIEILRGLEGNEGQGVTMADPKIVEMDLAVQINDVVLQELYELRHKVAWWEEKFSVLVENTGAKRERDELLAALKAMLTAFETELKSEYETSAGGMSCQIPSSIVTARALIARIEKPAPTVETRSYFRCKECGFEHWGGESCCGHGEACVEVPAP